MTSPVPDLPFATATAALSALADGTVSAVELTQAMLSRIAAAGRAGSPLRDVFAEHALDEARAVDARPREGGVLPLAGLPVAVKENIDTLPGRASAGFSFRMDHRAAADAPAVRALRAAGAIVIGTAVSDPGGFGVRTAEVAHPLWPGITVGGSSGGSAAALAAGFCYGALGTDTGGSIRIPAACCGVAGLKPTKGRFPLDGVYPLASSLDHVGPMARNVRDLPPLLRALDPGAFQVQARPMRNIIGYDPFHLDDPAAEVCQSFARQLDRLRGGGFSLREVRLPRPAEVRPVHSTIFCWEAIEVHRDNLARHAPAFGEEARDAFAYARSLTEADYRSAQRERADFRARVESLFDEVDFVVLPALPVLPPPLSRERFTLGGEDLDFTYALVRYTALFNHTGHPVACLPGVPAANGMPVGLQIVGPLDADAAVLAFAGALEGMNAVS